MILSKGHPVPTHQKLEKYAFIALSQRENTLDRHIQFFRRIAFAIVAVATMTSFVILWYGYEAQSRVKKIEQQWSQFNNYSSHTAYSLNRIVHEFGYGGFIHHFKNYVLRQDAKYFEAAKASLARTYAAIDRYLLNSPEDKLHIEAIRQVVVDYENKLQLVNMLIAQGKSTAEIDAQVRVDDTPANKALNQLTQLTLQRASKQAMSTSESVEKTLSLMQWGTIIIPLILLIGVALILFLKRTTDVNVEISRLQKFLNDVINSTPDPLLLVNQKGTIVRANVQAEKLFGYSNQELLSMQVEDLMPDHFRQAHHAQRQQAFSTQNARPFNVGLELKALNKSGEEIPIEISLSYTTQENDPLAITSIHDISERKKIEESLRLSQRIFEETIEAIVITDRNKIIVDANKAFCDITGYRREELIGKSPALLKSSRLSREFYRKIWQNLKQADNWKGEMWEKKKSGEEFPVLVSLSAVRNAQNQVSHYVAVISDISALKENEARLENLAHYDQLTGLANRTLFRLELNREIARARRTKKLLALLYIDLDGFKQVNDTLGHEAGDRVLQRAAAELQRSVRAYDTAARLGGDEFAVIFSNGTDEKEVLNLAQRIKERLLMQIQENALELTVSSSIGIAIFPEHGDSDEILMKHADEAMYEAKRAGKNRFHLFDQSKSD